MTRKTMVETTAQHQKSPLSVSSYDVTTAFAFPMRNLNFSAFLLHFTATGAVGFSHRQHFPFSSGRHSREDTNINTGGARARLELFLWLAEGACGYGIWDLLHMDGVWWFTQDARLLHSIRLSVAR